MVSLQLSAIASSLANDNLKLAGTLTPSLDRGPLAADAADGTSESGTNTAAALATKVPSSAPPPGAERSAQAIGTQMVLVFDDQTRSMTVKILDIFTQKVEQPAPLALETAAAQGAISGQGGSGTLVDTKA